MFTASFQNFEGISIDSLDFDESNQLDDDNDSQYSLANHIKDFNVNLTLRDKANWNALMEMQSNQSMNSSFVSDVSMSNRSASFHYSIQSLNNSIDFNRSDGVMYEPEQSILKGPLSTADEITQHSDRPKTA